MRPSTWITVAKRTSVWAALLAMPLAPAYAQDKASQAAQAPGSPELPKAKPVDASAAHSGNAPAAHSSDKTAAHKAPEAHKGQPADKTSAAHAAAAKPDKGKVADKSAPKPSAEPAATAVSAPVAPAPAQLAQAPLRLKPADAPQPSAAATDPACSLLEPEQPRGGRLDVVGNRFGTAPVVRIAGRPARQLERRNDRISVQIPADSDGGPITLLNDGKALACGNLVIIGKNR